MKKIEYVGYSLMIIAYTILLIEKLDLIMGLFISIFTIIIVLIILKYSSTDKKDDDFEHKELFNQSVGNSAKTKGDLTFKNINQTIDIKSDKYGKK